jgi:predicted homoserine dehydrogenase-like protein
VIIVDTALRAREAEGRPIRIGMVGAGFMGRGVANQVINHGTGMRISAIYARRVSQAVEAYAYATPGCEPVVADTQQALDRAIEAGTPVVTDDPFLLCRSPHLDALMDVTGAIELGARVALETFAHGKHLVLMNAELDATLGSILTVYARRHGVIVSTCDGDQPAVQINLYRFVTGLGLVPRVMGNVKGLQDRYRTPLTQREFARKWGQKPETVTSFADGSKVTSISSARSGGSSSTWSARSRGRPSSASPSSPTRVRSTT